MISDFEKFVTKLNNKTKPFKHNSFIFIKHFNFKNLFYLSIRIQFQFNFSKLW